ncbi:syntaxin-12 isoform X2 [Anopheles cruzii]|uniref:syntaxin-12 isoform X2 n=1 Tax=Anopheles cruzii TaxID=68878 RepID=UPI0022EC22C2|nr:syntaxin-12 isoform X2 [Anopheles cruzii]
MSREGLGLPRGIGQRDYGAMSSTAGGTGSTDANFGGFSPTEFISLSESIAANTIFVKQSWQSLEKANRTVGTAKDNQSLRDKITDIQTGTNQRITSTTNDLQRLTAVLTGSTRGGDKQQRLQVEKLTSDFKHVVEFYSKSQQSIVAKMKQVFLVNASQADDQASYGMGDSSSSSELLQKQMQIQQSLQFEQDMLVEREQRFRQIEENVLDVNVIMQKLSNLTSQQSEVIDTIENSIGRTAENVEDGAQELAKAATYQNRYRRKVLILLVIAVILGLIVTGTIVSKLKN